MSEINTLFGTQVYNGNRLGIGVEKFSFVSEWKIVFGIAILSFLQKNQIAQKLCLSYMHDPWSTCQKFHFLSSCKILNKQSEIALVCHFIFYMTVKGSCIKMWE